MFRWRCVGAQPNLIPSRPCAVNTTPKINSIELGVYARSLYLFLVLLCYYHIIFNRPELTLERKGLIVCSRYLYFYRPTLL